MFDSLRNLQRRRDHHMQLSDPVGQRTNILFRNVELNAPLDDGSSPSRYLTESMSSVSDMDLFARSIAYQPLAARMRPASLDEYAGQRHLLGRTAVANSAGAGALHSMIF